MVRVCCSKFHKGDPVFGEKAPYEDESLTHGFCEVCFEKEMEEIEKMGHLKKGWREEWREFKKNRGRRNMPRERQPKVGDFILFDDNTWVIKKISNKRYVVAECLDETGEKEEIIEEEFLLDNLAPTDIQTWEAE